MKLTAIIEREGTGFVSLCPELDIASQGDSVEQARDNLQEALELFFESASAQVIEGRLRGEVFVTQVEVAIGQAHTAYHPLKPHINQGRPPHEH
jgi:predicted RNase H-like HicB family nuclease